MRAPLLHTVFDTTTGETRVQGRDKRFYSMAEYEDARERARSGDAEALAFIDNLDHMAPGHGAQVYDPMQILHDCPECSAALARGEKPMIIVPPGMGRRFGKKKERWRTRKRSA